MTKNKDYQKQLDGQHRALADHLEKISRERTKTSPEQDQGLIIHWEKLLLIVVSKSPNFKGDSPNDNPHTRKIAHESTAPHV